MSRSSRRGFLLIAALGLSMWMGCGPTARPQLPEERNLKALAVLVGQYRSKHQGKSPPNLEALKAFVANADANSLKVLNIEPHEVERLFVSSRDHKPYVYRPSPSGAPKIGSDGKPVQHVLFHEADGIGGKRWVAYDLGGTELVDDAKFGQLISK